MKTLLIIVNLFAFQTMLSQSTKEDFSSFCQKFFGDSTYQISRIVFPIAWHQESPTIETKDSIIEKSNWSYSHFGYYSNQFNVQLYDNYHKQFRATNEMLVSFEGVECGINLNFYFRRIKSKWYLIKVIDNSD